MWGNKGGGQGCASGWIRVFGEAFSKQDMSATATGVRAQTLLNLICVYFSWKKKIYILKTLRKSGNMERRGRRMRKKVYRGKRK